MIVGLDEKVTAKFMEQLTVFKVQDYFILLGIRNDIDRVLDSTDVYLQPSRTEAISLSIMEAISHGIPVIATNVGGIPEVVIDNHNGYLITPEDSIFLSERMMQLIAAPQLAHKMGENGKDLSKQFTLKKGIDNLINIYNQL